MNKAKHAMPCQNLGKTKKCKIGCGKCKIGQEDCKSD